MSVIGAFGELRHAVLSPMYKGKVSSCLPLKSSFKQASAWTLDVKSGLVTMACASTSPWPPSTSATSPQGLNFLDKNFCQHFDYFHLTSSFNLSAGSIKGLCGHQTKSKGDCCHCMQAVIPRVDPFVAGLLGEFHEGNIGSVLVLGGDTASGATSTV